LKTAGMPACTRRISGGYSKSEKKKGPVGQTGKLSAHTGDTQTEGKIDQVPVKVAGVAGGLILLI